MINSPTKAKLLVISGPSGSGKSTILQKLFTEFPDKFGFSVSHNSRDPRQGEINGVHYHFMTKEKIEKMIENGEFLESAVYTNHLCGTRSVINLSTYIFLSKNIMVNKIIFF